MRRLVIMAKEPVAGRVKTRLVPPLSSGQAAALYRCLLEDTVDLVRGVPRVAGGIAYSPPAARGWFSTLVPEDFMLLPQPRGGLGNRLDTVFRRLFAGGAASACLMNSDGPDLPAAYLEEAFRLLEYGGAQVVFGPNHDGGYYLVGLREPEPLFDDIPWSTDRVLEVSLQKARRAGLATRLLPPWQDLDTMEDLRSALARWRSGESAPPRRTYPCLEALIGSSGIPSRSW
jgi:rSAM/selenodomain-associated transferase 1